MRRVPPAAARLQCALESSDDLAQAVADRRGWCACSELFLIRVILVNWERRGRGSHAFACFLVLGLATAAAAAVRGMLCTDTEAMPTPLRRAGCVSQQLSVLVSASHRPAALAGATVSDESIDYARSFGLLEDPWLVKFGEPQRLPRSMQHRAVVVVRPHDYGPALNPCLPCHPSVLSCRLDPL